MSTATIQATLETTTIHRSAIPLQDQTYRALVDVSSPDRAVDQAQLDTMDWESLFRLARHHSLTPLLAHRLLESRISLPSHVRARLRSDFQANMIRNFGLLEETKRILSSWSAEGIRAIPYKGPVLAEQLWGSFALRECSDLDFLVPRSEINCAGEALGRIGYRRVFPVADSLRPNLLRNASEEQFKHPESGILLELQWAPAPRTLAIAFDEDQMWRRATSILVAGEVVSAPHPEDLVALLAIHGWKHNWSKLIWIADLAAVLRCYDINWERIQESACRSGWKRILLLGLEMVRRVYGALYADYDDPFLLALAQELEQNLRQAKNNSYLDWHRNMLRARDSRFSQMRQLANFIFTPGLGEYASSALPGWAAPGYRVIRLARVLSLWPEKALS